MKHETFELIGRIGERLTVALVAFMVVFFGAWMIHDHIDATERWEDVERIFDERKEAERQRAFEASLDNFARKNNNNDNR
ncbi:MAG: hypothetical protein CMM47_01585 [Rhodospirillaceae bacterium]|nr:hypothetical protein [Rhodospirillaceae bacterium]